MWQLTRPTTCGLLWRMPLQIFTWLFLTAVLVACGNDGRVAQRFAEDAATESDAADTTVAEETAELEGDVAEDIQDTLGHDAGDMGVDASDSSTEDVWPDDAAFSDGTGADDLGNATDVQRGDVQQIIENCSPVLFEPEGPLILGEPTEWALGVPIACPTRQISSWMMDVVDCEILGDERVVIPIVNVGDPYELLDSIVDRVSVHRTTIVPVRTGTLNCNLLMSFSLEPPPTIRIEESFPITIEVPVPAGGFTVKCERYPGDWRSDILLDAEIAGDIPCAVFDAEGGRQSTGWEPQIQSLMFNGSRVDASDWSRSDFLVLVPVDAHRLRTGTVVGAVHLDSRSRAIPAILRPPLD